MARSFRTRRSRGGRGHGSALPAVVRGAVRSSGEPLEGEVLAQMESGFGHDFSRVRVHADADAARSARALGARAYTVGEDVVFGSGGYDPKGGAGRERIAHELAHVVQQEQTVGTPARALSSPTDRSEAVARSAAARVAAGGSAPSTLGSAEARVSREVEPGWQDGGQGGGSVDSPAPPAPATNVLQEFDVDRKKGGKPWNLDKLTRQIGEALKGAEERHIEVVGYYDVSEEESAGDARDAARKRAEVVRRALLQWIPTLKGRLRVSTRDRDLWREWAGEQTRRQVGVEWVAGPVPREPGPRVPEEPLPEGVPARPEAEPSTAYPGASGTWPAEPLDVLRVFFASPPGQELKAFLKKNGKQLWEDFKKLPPGQIAALLISQGVPIAIVAYTVSAMTEAQRASFGKIVPELDEAALRPLPEKTWNVGLDVDPDFGGPRKVRTPLGDFDVGPERRRPGVTALGIDLRIVKAATKTFFKAGESISVSYAVPDEGWRIQVVSDDKTRTVVETRKIPYPTKDGSMAILAPDAAGIYTLNLLDGLDGEPKRTVRFRVQ